MFLLKTVRTKMQSFPFFVFLTGTKDIVIGKGVYTSFPGISAIVACELLSARKFMRSFVIYKVGHTSSSCSLRCTLSPACRWGLIRSFGTEAKDTARGKIIR